MSLDPVSIAIAGINAISTIKGASAQRKAANQQAAQAEQAAQRQRQIADINARRVAEKNRKTKSRLLATQSAGGADTGSGSALLIQQDLAAEDSLEQDLARLDGITNAQNLEQQARVTRFNARNAQKKAVFGVGTNLLGNFEGLARFDLLNGNESSKKAKIGDKFK